MNSLASLFYQENYDAVEKELAETQDPSLQEIHNLAIVRFLTTGENPLPQIQKIADSIKADTPSDNWPIHPSWNLLNYHIALYHFEVRNTKECSSVLESLWNNSECVDDLIILCVSLLTIEYSIRVEDHPCTEKALEFFNKEFSEPETLSKYLKSKNYEDQFIEKIIEDVSYAKLRYDVARLTRKPIEESKIDLENILNAVPITQDAKNRILLPVKQVIPLACAALYTNDQAIYVPVLETSANQNHYALLNNRGIYELLQSRYSSALLHFSKALDARHNSAVVHPYHQIVYNIGLSLLMRQRPQEAFQYLYSIIPLMSRSPYLWLRLAECCLMFYKQRVAKLRKETQLSPVIARKFCTSTRSFIILPQTDYKLFEKYQMKDNEGLEHLDLYFAEKCTRNCIALCNEDLAPVRRSAELICSFISLEFGDGRRAAEVAKSVYTSTVVDPQIQFLAKIYAAQGYSLMGDTAESNRILSRLLIESSRDLREKEAFTVHSLTFTRVSMESQDLRKAQNLLSRLQESDIAPGTALRPEVVLTRVALELKNRKPLQALSTIHAYSKLKEPQY